MACYPYLLYLFMDLLRGEYGSCGRGQGGTRFRHRATAASRVHLLVLPNLNDNLSVRNTTTRATVHNRALKIEEGGLT